MPFNIVCPKCQSRLSVPDEMAGQASRCPYCQQVFRAPAAPASAVPQAKPIDPTRALQQKPTPPKATGEPVGTTAADFDVDFDVDEPRPSRRPRRESRFEQEPRRPRPREPKSSSVLVQTLIIIGISVVAIGAVVGVGIYFMSDGDQVDHRAAVQPPLRDRDRLDPDIKVPLKAKPPVPVDDVGEPPDDPAPPLRRDQDIRVPPEPRFPPRIPVPVPPIRKPPPPIEPWVKNPVLDPERWKKQPKVHTFEVSGALPCLCWTRDHDSFYSVTGLGVIRKISIRNLQVEKSGDLQEKVSWLSLSAEGLLLALYDRQEAWLLDEKTFKVKKRFKTASISRAVSAPGVSYAFAVGFDRWGDGSLVHLDLKTGKTTAITGRFRGRGGFKNLCMSPDGKYLFAQGGIEQLIRYRIDGAKIQMEDSTERIASNGQGVFVSPDSKYVCLPAGGGNGPGYSTYIYSTNHLKQRRFTLESGAYPRCVGFDPKAGLIYTQNHDEQLIVFNEKGIKLQSYRLSRRGNGPAQMLAHPEGSKLLMVLNGDFRGNKTRLLWIELPGSTNPAKKGAQAPPVKPAPVDKPKVARFQATKLNLSGVLSCLCWARDHQSFYSITRLGKIQRMSIKDFSVSKSVDLVEKVSWLGLSKQGLLVSLYDRQETWLLDEDSLKVKKKFKTPKSDRFASSPNSDVAFAVPSGAALRGLDRLNPMVTALDLKAGKTKTIQSKDRRFFLQGGYRFARMTPDGRYVFAEGGLNCLVRYRVDGTNLILDEKSDSIASNASEVQISPDSRYVSLPSGGGNGPGYVTYVYAVDDLKKRAFSLEAGAYPRLVGFDPKAGLVYTQNSDYPLMIFDYKGIKKSVHKIADGGDEPLQFLPHPEGGKLLVLLGDRLRRAERPSQVYWVTVPK